MKKTWKLTALVLALILMLSALAGCAKTETETKTDTKATQSDGLYFTQQEVRKSPEWVTKLDATKDAEQLIVVAGVGKTTAYVTMHEKNTDGEWEQIIATPGFIGKDGLGDHGA